MTKRRRYQEKMSSYEEAMAEYEGPPKDNQPPESTDGQAIGIYERAMLGEGKFESKREPLFWRIIYKLSFHDRDAPFQNVLIAVVMAGIGVLVLVGLYSTGWLEPGVLRGICAWFTISLCFSKTVNYIDPCGPLPTAFTALIFVILIELYAFAAALSHEAQG